MNPFLKDLDVDFLQENESENSDDFFGINSEFEPEHEVIDVVDVE